MRVFNVCRLETKKIILDTFVRLKQILYFQSEGLGTYFINNTLIFNTLRITYFYTF